MKHLAKTPCHPIWDGLKISKIVRFAPRFSRNGKLIRMSKFLLRSFKMSKA